MNITPEIVDFLAQKRVAVVGVSRRHPNAANIIYRAMRDRGYSVFAINPAASYVEGDLCYPDLASISEPVGAVVIGTPAAEAEGVLREAAALRIRRVWIHRSLFGQGSFSESALAAAEELGVMLIPSGCPMMFMRPVDPGHACMRWLGQEAGRVPAHAE